MQVAALLCCVWLASCAAVAATGGQDASCQAPAPADASLGCYQDVAIASDVVACPTAPTASLPAGASPPDLAPPAAFFPGKSCIRAPTLDVRSGFTPHATGQFQAYVDHGWAPLVTGLQGGLHVPFAFEVVLPGVDEAKVKLRLHATVLTECGEVSVGPPNIVAVQATAMYTYRATVDIESRFTGKSSADAPLFCGRWVRVALQIQEPTSGAWGQVSHVVQLYSPGGTP